MFITEIGLFDIFLLLNFLKQKQPAAAFAYV